MSFHIEYLRPSGFWAPLEQSTIETGFKMRPHPTFATRDECEAHIAEMRSVSDWRGLRAAEAPQPQPQPQPHTGPE